MAKRVVGVALDFMDELGCNALHWARDYLSLNGREDELHIIHVVHTTEHRGVPCRLIEKVEYKNIERIQVYKDNKDVENARWGYVQKEACKVKRRNNKNDVKINVHIYKSSNIMEGLKKAAEECGVMLLVVGSAALRATRSNNGEPPRFPAEFENANFSVTIVRERATG